jgi:hypothetical protein
LTEFLLYQAEYLVIQYELILLSKPFDAPLDESLERDDVREKRWDEGDVFQLDRLLISRRWSSSLDLDFAIADNWNPSAASRQAFARVGEPYWPRCPAEVIADMHVCSRVKDEARTERKLVVLTTRRRENR